MIRRRRVMIGLTLALEVACVAPLAQPTFDVLAHIFVLSLVILMVRAPTPRRMLEDLVIATLPIGLAPVCLLAWTSALSLIDRSAAGHALAPGSEVTTLVTGFAGIGSRWAILLLASSLTGLSIRFLIRTMATEYDGFLTTLPDAPGR